MQKGNHLVLAISHTPFMGIGAASSSVEHARPDAAGSLQDITFGQIIPVINFFGTLISAPTALVDFSMHWVGQETWKRDTRVFGFISAPIANYNARRIINGDGSKGYWFDKGWLTDRGGIPVAVGVPVSPPY
jgi:hypothetical protein